MSDAAKIFASVEAAYNSMDVQEIKVSGVMCRTDASVHAGWPDGVTIDLIGDMGKTQLRLARTDVARALQEYKRILL